MRGPPLALQAIMRVLLGYIGKERHADSLVEKLALRFQAAAGAAQWRSLAFCLTQVGPHPPCAPAPVYLFRVQPCPSWTPSICPWLSATCHVEKGLHALANTYPSRATSGCGCSGDADGRRRGLVDGRAPLKVAD